IQLRTHGAYEKRTADLNSLNPLTDNLPLQCDDVTRNIRQLRHGGSYLFAKQFVQLLQRPRQHYPYGGIALTKLRGNFLAWKILNVTQLDRLLLFLGQLAQGVQEPLFTGIT